MTGSELDASLSALGADPESFRDNLLDSLLAISVADSGVGIAPENLVKVFEYGFTTMKDGHEFGLSGGARSAQKMGGRLAVFSADRDLGATLSLEIPIHSASQG